MRRPLLVWPQARRALDRSKASGGGGRPQGPGATRQGVRLAPKFQALQHDLARQVARLETSPEGADPELVVVFDVVGPIASFQSAVRRISDLEWLAEGLCDDEDAYEDFSDVQGPRRLYFIAASRAGMDQILSLWARFRAERDFDHGLGAWKTLFDLLHDVRRWGRRDRLSEATLGEWVAAVESGKPFVDAEIDLWLRSDRAERSAAKRRLHSVLSAHDIEVLDGPVVVEEAGVHLLLARLPAALISVLAEQGDLDLVELTDVRAFRVAAQAVAVADSPTTTGEMPPCDLPSGSPVVAVLDGLPMQNHERLAGRIRVEDPEGWEALIPVAHRNHGTAVCSVALWGDLSAARTPASRPIYVRPILMPDPQRPTEECGPPDRLFLDVLHGAVARMFEGETPAAPDVAVVNLSIGEVNRVFDGFEMSALARLVDYLAWHYELLFVVSTGNWKWRVERFGCARTHLEDAENRHPRLLRRLHDLTAERMLLSPAESINALTVGALDADGGAPGSPPNYVAPWGGQHEGAPAVYSRVGLGLRNAPKPDLVAAGGRQPVEVHYQDAEQSWLQPYGARNAHPSPGIQVAAPGKSPAPQNQGVRFLRGTSFAAPLVTNAAARISDELDALLATYPDLLERAPRAVWIKTLLVHAASRKGFDSWVEPLVEGDSKRRWRSQRKQLDKFVGYGALELDIALGCSAHRVTVLAGGRLKQDMAHEYRFPLPNSLLDLERRRFSRSLRITLSWLTPPWATSARYRGAVLSLDAIEKTPGLTFTKGSDRPDALRNGAGTVLHLVKHGSGVATFVKDGEIRLKVNCRADAASRFDEAIPYALAATLEVDEALPVDIYQDVETALATVVPIPVGAH